MKGKVLKILDVLQQRIPTFYPPTGARVLCVREHVDVSIGESWYEVLYEDKIYAVEEYMVKEQKIQDIVPGSLVVLNSGKQAIVLVITESEALGSFFTILVDEEQREISAMDIKEIISAQAIVK